MGHHTSRIVEHVRVRPDRIKSFQRLDNAGTPRKGMPEKGLIRGKLYLDFFPRGEVIHSRPYPANSSRLSTSYKEQGLSCVYAFPAVYGTFLFRGTGERM